MTTTSLMSWFNKLNECEIDGKKFCVKIVGTTEKPWFKASDVCKALGYTRTDKALIDHVKSQYKSSLNDLVRVYPGLGDPLFRRDREGQQPYITEAGLYALIFASRLPTADAFRTWVFEDVLPSIRKEGQYQLAQSLETKSVELSTALKAIEEEKAIGVQTRAMVEKERQAKEAALAAEKVAKEATETERKAKEDALAYALVLKEMVIPTNKRTFDEVIYISTSRAYAKQNRFKVGGVEHVDKLKSRFSVYNGRSAAGDEWYFSDVFKVANFKACEKRIEDVLGRFRDKKEKEIYVMHYTDLLRYLKFICDNYEDELETFNADLSELINNLNRHHAEPAVPKPYEGTTATIVRIVKGVPMNTRIESAVEELFKEKVREYLDTLPSTTTELRRSDLFERMPFQFNKISGWKWLKEIVPEYKPEVTIKYK